jgi:hypothetical protein
MSRPSTQWCRPVGVDVPSERALQQIAFRQARRRLFNDRLAAIDPDAEVERFRCECGLIACGTVIGLSANDYAELRSTPLRFAVYAEHVLPEVDRVVTTHGGWVTVASTARHVDYRRARQHVVDAAPPCVEKHR